METRQALVGELAASVGETCIAAAPAPALELIAQPMAPPVTSAPLLPRMKPLSPGRFSLQVTISERAQELFRYAQCLLGHRMPSASIEQVLELALEQLVEALESEKFGRTAHPRAANTKAHGRHIPASLRRAVCERDGGQCTFVAGDRRCNERMRLEFDHVKAVALGGETSLANLRLRCQPHNQYEAEQALGRGFMERRRISARRVG